MACFYIPDNHPQLVFADISYCTLSPLLRAWYNIDNILGKVYFGGTFDPAHAKVVFENHCKHVRSVVPKAQLLELSFDDGWQELCEFL